MRRADGPAWLAVALLAPAAAQATVEFDGGISLLEVYTDNVSLAPSGEEEEDWVTMLAPSISVNALGNRYSAGIDYELQMFYYARADDDTAVFSNGSAFADLELLPEHFFLNTSAEISQVVVDPSGTVPFGNLPVSGNRTDAITLEAMPEWRQELFNHLLTASYTIGQTDYDRDDISDVVYDRVDANIVSPMKERGLSWSADYEYRGYDYDEGPDDIEEFPKLERALGMASVFWNFSGGWAPYGSWGRESDIEDRTDASLTESIWRAGLRRNTPTTSFDGYYGERSFGKSWGGLFERRRAADPGDLIRLSYDENPTISEDLGVGLIQDSFVIDPILDPTLPPLVSPIGVSQLFLRKRGELRIVQAFNRNTVSLVGFVEKNEDILLTEDSTDLTNTEQRGGSVIWRYQPGTKTEIVTQVLFTDRDFESDAGVDEGSDQLWRLRLGVDYALGLRTDITFWVARTSQDSDGVSSDYDENQVGIGINRALF